MLIGTTSTAARVEVIDERQIRITVGGQRFLIEAHSGTQQPRVISEDGTMSVEVGDLISIAGDGLKADTWLSMWLFSSPTAVGEIPVDAAGRFDGAKPVPATVKVGMHTLQLNGISASGKLVSLTLGLEVVPKGTAAVWNAKKRTAAFFFRSRSKALTGWERTRVLYRVKYLPIFTAITCRGYTYTAKPTSAEKQWAKAHALAVCKLLVGKTKRKYTIQIASIKTAVHVAPRRDKRLIYRADLITLRK